MPGFPDNYSSHGISIKRVSRCIFFPFFVLFVIASYSQDIIPGKNLFSSQTNIHGADLFGTQQSFIKNINQYGKTVTGFENMGTILYGYEGLGMPVLFTSKGLIHLQRKGTVNWIIIGLLQRVKYSMVKKLMLPLIVVYHCNFLLQV